MNTMLKVVLSVPVLAVLAAQPAPAQQRLPDGVMVAGQMDDDPGFDPGPQGGGIPDERREEIRKKVAAVRIYRLTEELKLNADTSARMAALLGSIDSDRAALVRERREDMRKLRELVAERGRGGERQLREVLDRLERNHRRMTELREREWKGVRDLLTVEQQAQYLLFHQQFLRDMRGMVAGSRGGQGPGMRGGPGRGMGPGQGFGPGPGPGPGGMID